MHQILNRIQMINSNILLYALTVIYNTNTGKSAIMFSLSTRYKQAGTSHNRTENVLVHLDSTAVHLLDIQTEIKPEYQLLKSRGQIPKLCKQSENLSLSISMSTYQK